MKRFLLVLLTCFIITTPLSLEANASLVSSKSYRIQENRIYKKELKQIKKLFKIHNTLANKHNLEGLRTLYTENYVNNDGFNKEIYFKNIFDTWDECKDITYKINISKVQINGNYASVWVEEFANGTVYDSLESISVTGEIHSVSTGIYYLTKIGDKWLISGETILEDQSSLLYGDARFMNIELQAPSQVSAGKEYTTSVKVDTDEKTIIIGSIDKDPVTYPTNIPNAPLRALPKTNILERVLKANNDNINEYVVASLAISKAKGETMDNYSIYMAGLACLMQRINVIPKNNFTKIEDEI